MRRGDGAAVLLAAALALGFGGLGSHVVNELAEPMPRIIHAFEPRPVDWCVRPAMEGSLEMTL